MYLLNRMIVWLRRFHLSRGMGVQSPSAYRFIRYVVSEHYPYYAYADLGRKAFGINKRRAKLCRFYFRLANYVQPSTIFNYAPFTEAYEVYMQTGCRKAHILSQDADGCDVLMNVESLDMARISLMGDYRSAVSKALSKSHGGSVFVIEHIKRNRETQMFWEELLRDDRVGVSFDLYYCGVLFFDKKKYKQNYKVNF